MDTRTKILPIEKFASALETGDWLVVAGLFDPLTAVQARRLADLANNGRGKLIAIVLTGDDPLLPADARASLIAGLREVSFVVNATSGEWRKLIPQESRVRLLEDPEGERARTADFIQFVLNRQNA